jgi:hypothetical protein
MASPALNPMGQIVSRLAFPTVKHSQRLGGGMQSSANSSKVNGDAKNQYRDSGCARMTAFGVLPLQQTQTRA